MKNILWVDDDPLVLSSAKRLLRMHGFNIHTIDNPLLVEDWLTQNTPDVIVSDQRMPQMTGTTLLSNIKNKFPQITRIMVTGFMDQELVQQSINEADVFRFITKPWVETELLADIVQGIEHSEKLKSKETLSSQIREQNKVLQKFTENLEEIIFERTFELASAQKEQAHKNIKIKNLVKFIQDLNVMKETQEIIHYFYNDFKKEFGIINCFFAYTDFNLDSKILFQLKNKWVESKVEKFWSAKKEIRTFDKEDQQYLSNEIKMPITQLLSVPLMRFREDLAVPHTLFIECDFKQNVENEKISAALDFITSRLQILSLGIERILSNHRVEFESERWEKTFDSISDPLCVLDKNYQVLRKNSVFDKQIHEVSREIVEKKVLHKNSRIYQVYLYGIEEASSHSFENYLCYFRDVTEERMLYQKLLQGEKMVAVGLLAGNIAHELNNPLTGIRSMAQLLTHSSTTKEAYISDLTEIDRACQRCQSIIQSLIDFSDIKEGSLMRISLQDVVNKTLPLLKTALRFHSTKILLPEKDVFILGEMKLLQQVLFNLVHNACQAMSETGVVTIQVKTSKKKAVLEVSDTGPGVSPEILSRLFEPFASTKKEGEGTGLGLSFSKNVVEKMNGQITLLKSSSDGASFQIQIPEIK